MNHPKVMELIKGFQNKSNKGTYIYVPVEICQNQEIRPLFDTPMIVQSESTEDDVSENVTKDEESCEKKLHIFEQQNRGKYTIKERQEKIRKYKEKILKWKLGKNKNKNQYAKRRDLAKCKPRFQGKFIKQSSSV